MRFIDNAKIYEEGDIVSLPSGDCIAIAPGEVGIAMGRGLTCICKDNADLIRLSIISHREGRLKYVL